MLINKLILATSVLFLSSSPVSLYTSDEWEIMPRAAVGSQKAYSGTAKMKTIGNTLQTVNYNVTVYMSWDDSTGRVLGADFGGHKCTVPASGVKFTCTLETVSITKATYYAKYTYKAVYTLNGVKRDYGSPNFTITRYSPGQS
ncbi:hypothetical protein GSF08_09310 [Clostridiaceae bacterium DONG20-135]|uniref:Uncharacterized protein n=1 Tax=Copranaerobaculum intestinale TaxID=2692629 RepID=A0A6N8U9I0_9FIRM|nr:hypothetical protein [Copranaerobaculum intestinale]MXQ74135.1 hypothetical protein [Copranaerobaculum intestinale]